MSTANFNIKPENGWVVVTTADVGFIRIASNTPTHAFFVTSGTVAPVATDVGYKVLHKAFWVDTSPATGVRFYVRTMENAPNGVRFDVYTEAPAAGGGGGGDATAANQVITNTEIGGLTETAPATDTASSGLNGRLQRIAQRLTSLIALFPASIGAKTGAGSFSVVPNTDTAFPVVGNVASATTDSGNPVKISGVFNTAPPTVTAGQRVDVQTDANANIRVRTAAGSASGVDGQSNASIITTLSANTASNGISLLPNSGYVFNGTAWDRQRGDVSGSVTQPHAMTSSRWGYAAASGGITNSTTAVTFIAAAGASLRNYVTGIQISAGTLGAATEIAIRDGAAGTVLWRGTITTAGGNMSVTFPVPIKGTANTLMEVVTLTATVTGSVYFNAQGFTGI